MSLFEGGGVISRSVSYAKKSLFIGLNFIGLNFISFYGL